MIIDAAAMLRDLALSVIACGAVVGIIVATLG